MRRRGRAGDVAGKLRRGEFESCQRGEGLGRIVARLDFERRPVDRRPIEARRRAGLEAAEREAGLVEAAGEGDRGGSPKRPAGVRLSPRWMIPRRKVPVVMTSARQASVAAVGEVEAANRARADVTSCSLPPR